MATGGDKSLSLSVQQLLENPEDDFLGVSGILLTFATNIANEPSNEKYRKIRIGNHTVQTRLLPFSGALECLFEMGFEEDPSGEFLVLSQGKDLSILRKIQTEIIQEREKMDKKEKVGPRIHTEPANKTIRPQLNQQDIVASQLSFFNRLKTGCDHVHIYEKQDQQAKALQVIPREQLMEKANKRLQEVCSKLENKDKQSVSISDMLLLELLHWFKFDFFSWIDAPVCQKCAGPTVAVGMAEPSPQDLHWGASRVENYLCSTCNCHTRFPRYNDPGKLLESRKGRCGEWANCFTLCCRAMGFEARHVIDWTDHVWTEVYSTSQKRWLHCDPCENACDKPLLYENGWGKKLSYIIAFSVDDVQDVTWRYSAKHDDVRARRRQCDEMWLLDKIVRLRAQRQSNLSQARKKELVDRLVVELVEMLTLKTAGEGEDQGRITGSVAWRNARGELGQTKPESTIFKPTVIKPSAHEQYSKIVHLKYCCASDQYIRVSDNNAVTKSWQSMAHTVQDVLRKEEHDWKMVYLARKENSKEASLSWQFDFSESNLVIDTVEVTAESHCFEDGQVMWRLCGKEQCAILPPGNGRRIISDLSGENSLSITATLRRGEGDCAWQHTQLFRQKMDDNQVFPFDIKVTLKMP